MNAILRYFLDIRSESIGQKQKCLPASVASAAQQDGNAIMIWGWITSEGPGECKAIIGTMNSDKYGDSSSGIVTSNRTPPCHRSKQPGNDSALVPWPPHSPDLNPVENLWNTMAYRLAKYKPRNGVELRLAVCTLWQVTCKESRKLIHSMPDRIKACYKTRGGPIDY